MELLRILVLLLSPFVLYRLFRLYQIIHVDTIVDCDGEDPRLKIISDNYIRVRVLNDARMRYSWSAISAFAAGVATSGHLLPFLRSLGIAMPASLLLVGHFWALLRLRGWPSLAGMGRNDAAHPCPSSNFNAVQMPLPAWIDILILFVCEGIGVLVSYLCTGA